MNIALDVIFLAIIGGAAFKAYRAGFVKTILQFISLLLSCILAFVVSARWTPVINERFVYPMMSDTLHQQMGSAVQEASGGVLEILSGIVSGIAMIFADLLGQQISMSLSETITRVILLFLLFTLFSILFGIVIFVVDTAFKLPVLHSLNQIAGLGIGLLQGIVTCMLLCVAISFFVTMFQNVEESPISGADIEKTIIVHHIYNNGLVKPLLFE